jgi:hypothetical protein
MGLSIYPITYRCGSDITDNQVQIITSAPSLGATDIERLITFPMNKPTVYSWTERNSKFFLVLAYQW